jgi:acyl carrier protein
MTTKERVYKLISEKANSRFDDETWLVSIMDSLNRYELIYDLESEFSVYIDEIESQAWETPKDIIDYIENKLLT